MYVNDGNLIYVLHWTNHLIWSWHDCSYYKCLICTCVSKMLIQHYYLIFDLTVSIANKCRELDGLGIIIYTHKSASYLRIDMLAVKTNRSIVFIDFVPTEG